MALALEWPIDDWSTFSHALPGMLLQSKSSFNKLHIHYHCLFWPLYLGFGYVGESHPDIHWTCHHLGCLNFSIISFRFSSHQDEDRRKQGGWGYFGHPILAAHKPLMVHDYVNSAILSSPLPLVQVRAAKVPETAKLWGKSVTRWLSIVQIM